MTTQIKVAMFAVLAVAALSLGMAPMQEAFAWTSTNYQYMSTTSPTQGNTNSDTDYKSICGQTIQATTHVKNNNPSDKVEVWYNISHCQDWEKVLFEVNINGGPIEYSFIEYNNASGAQLFSPTFGSSGGDTVAVTVTYYW